MNIGGRVAVAVRLAMVGAAFFGGSLPRRGAADIVASRRFEDSRFALNVWIG
jgi:hypothetical protein